MLGKFQFHVGIIIIYMAILSLHALYRQSKFKENSFHSFFFDVRLNIMNSEIHSS